MRLLAFVTSNCCKFICLAERKGFRPTHRVVEKEIHINIYKIQFAIQLGLNSPSHDENRDRDETHLVLSVQSTSTC